MKKTLIFYKPEYADLAIKLRDNYHEHGHQETDIVSEEEHDDVEYAEKMQYDEAVFIEDRDNVIVHDIESGYTNRFPVSDVIYNDSKSGCHEGITNKQKRGDYMSITINIYYTGEENGAAIAFAREMEQSGIADRIRAEEGNLRYEYFTPLDDEKTVLLIDSWKNQEALDVHHASPMMKKIVALREKYDLHMKVERFTSVETQDDSAFIRK